MGSPCESALNETCLEALRVVAREGWLCKSGWSISKAVHAFAKPTKARLTSSIDDAVVSGQHGASAAFDDHASTARRLGQRAFAATLLERV
jgi:hypothetical protein